MHRQLQRFTNRILIRGADDIASGIAYRLVKAGFPVVMTDLPNPLCVRTNVSYSSAITNRSVIIGGVVGRHATPAQVSEFLAQGVIAILSETSHEILTALNPTVIVEARHTNADPDTTINDAPLVIGIGAGFAAGEDCHAVIETHEGHDRGRVLWSGRAARLSPLGKGYLLRSPADGTIWQFVQAGEFVKAGALIARIGEVPLTAPFDGVLRGMVDFHVPATTGAPIGELDAHIKPEHCFTISGDVLAVGGGVLEAIFSAPQVRLELA